MKSLLNLVLLVVALAFFAACEKAPQQEVDAAKAALETAKASEAEIYAAQDFNMAQDTLNMAVAEIEAQNAKFALTRNYDQAKKLLASATGKAASAQTNATENKAMVKAEVENLLATINTDIEATRAMMKKAPKGKEGKAALQMMTQELDAVVASVAEANNLYTAGKFMAAKDNLTANKDKVMSLQNELTAAMTKTRK